MHTTLTSSVSCLWVPGDGPTVTEAGLWGARVSEAAELASDSLLCCPGLGCGHNAGRGGKFRYPKA